MTQTSAQRFVPLHPAAAFTGTLEEVAPSVWGGNEDGQGDT